MKYKILILISVIFLLFGVGGISYAYFTSAAVQSNNRFSTGTVLLSPQNLNGFQFDLSGLIPGQTHHQTVSFTYSGTINADIYFGARGTSSSEDQEYLANYIDLVITDNNSGQIVYQGTAEGLSLSWQLLAQNINQNSTKEYDVSLTLNINTPNTKQGVNNTDTEFLLYAVQSGGNLPATPPYLTWNL